MVRAAEGSKREDDNEETLKKRLRSFQELSKPVVDMYSRLGKVKRIDASKPVSEVFQQTKKAMLPQVFFMIGPKGCGKSTVARELGTRTQMQVINFDKFLIQAGQNPDDFDDEEATLALVNSLVNETAPRILLEDFPRTEKQARLFIHNCITPSEVFYIKCSKDICQERLLELGTQDPNYLSSNTLTQDTKKFNENNQTMLPFLKSSASFREINGEQILKNVLRDVYAVVEPTVIHVRSGANDALAKQIIQELTSERWGYSNLDVNALISQEERRKTAIGFEIHQLI